MNVRKSLLSSVSLLAINTMVVATAVFYPTLAQAQCSTITSDATINDAATNCVVWNGGEISITNNGTIAAGIGFSINGGTVGNLINSGVVYGAGHALYNAGTIPTISNLAGGIISGNSGPYVVGIDNEGSIGTILNSGSILTKNYLNYDVINNNGSIGLIINYAGGVFSGGSGLASYGPFLGTIINSGVIEGVFRGMSAGSTLGTIVNNAGGTISGGNSGIWNNGHFYDTITNSGLIEGRVAIINQGEIAGTINSIFNLSGGIISGSSTAISNIYTSSIGAINNVGTIAAGSYGIIVGSNSTIININNSGTISGAVTAIKDRGTIDTIINSGLIVGNSALVIGGTIFSALSNTGTISGNINVSQDLSITGHGGTLSGGSIVTNNNSLTFTSVANQVLVDNINVGTNTVTNLGTLVLNSSQSIAGNYNQATSGLLDMNATNFTSHGELIVSGVATLSNDFISLTGALTNETLTIVSGSLGTSYSNVSVSASGYSISTISTIIGSTDDLVVSLVRALPAGCSITNASSSTSINNGCNVVWSGGSGSHLTITGTVAGSAIAIINVGNTVGNLINSGTISGTASALNNSGVMGSILNSGTLNSANIAIVNTGTIGSIINSNLIMGITAVNSTGTILGALNNTGTISGNLYINHGLNIIGSGGSIIGGSLTTSDSDLILVSGASQTFGDSLNLGAGNLTNLGTIAGNISIANGMSVGSIINSGLISASINIASGGSLTGVLINYGTLGGNINVNQALSISGSNGAIAGGSIVTNNNNLIFTSIANQVLSDNINVGSGTVVNGGTLTLNHTQSIQGNYFQAASGLLNIGVSSSDHGNLVVSGLANFNSDLITLTGSLGAETLTIASGSLGSYFGGITVSADGYKVVSSIGTIGSFDDLIVTLTDCSITNVSNNMTLNNGCHVEWSGGSTSHLTITGNVSGSATGIVNAGNTVGNLINNGTISGTVSALNNSGLMGSLLNSGTLSSSSIAIFNTGTIGSIINSELISGRSRGIYGSYGSSIGLLNNSGTISGNYAGIYSGSATITSIVNTGTIIGTNYAIVNGGGLIGGGPTAINSSGGTISGALYNEGTISGNIIANQTLSIAGGSGTLMGGSITANNLVFLDHTNQYLQENIVASSGSGIVTNNGTLQLMGVQSITGNYTQGSVGQLVIGVTNNSNYGELIVSGAASLSSGWVDLTTIGGSALSAGESFTIAEASTSGSAFTGVHAFSAGFIATATASTIGNNEFLNVSLSACSNQAINVDTTFSGTACGLTWNAGQLSITSSGYVAGSATAVFNSGNTVGILTNAGFIVGQYGLKNSGTIGAIINEAGGVMSGNDTGVFNNSGSIGTLSNDGVISGQYVGIYNEYGSIGTLINRGVISGSSAGVYMYYGNIGTLSNSGVITAADSGIVIESGNVGTLSNSGVINGFYEGIYNEYGDINVINNSGTVSANNVGIYNYYGSIDAINNSGTVSGISNAINNYGSIGTISNSGAIFGQNAISSTGTILAPITNTGTIAGNINVNQDLTITGGNDSAIGTLMGYGTVAGTIAATDLFFDSNAYQLLNDDVNVGIGTVSNAGTLKINATHTITGNYTQNSSGLLIIGVSNPASYGNFLISGNAILTNDRISIIPVSGTLLSGNNLTIVQGATLGSNYNNITVSAADGLTATAISTIIGNFDDLIIRLSGTPSVPGTYAPETYAPVGNAVGGGSAPAIGIALDQILNNNNNPSFTPIFTALNNLGANSTVAEGNAFKQLAPAPLTPQIAASHFAADQTFQMIGHHQDYLFSAADRTQLSSLPLGESAGEAYQVGSLWMQVSGGKAVQNSTSTVDGYQQSFYNMTFGVDNHINKDFVIGTAVSWQQSSARGGAGLNGDSVNVSTPEITGYGSYRYGPAYVNGILGFGYNTYHESRDIQFINSTATASYHGVQYMGKIETGWDYSYEDIIITRLMGFDAVHTFNQSYTETGAGVADESVKSQAINSYATTLGGKIATTFTSAWGDLTPALKLVWVHDLLRGPITTDATLAGVSFATTTARVSQNGAQIGFSTMLQEDDDLSISAEYDGDLRQGYSSHSGQIKVKWDF